MADLTRALTRGIGLAADGGHWGGIREVANPLPYLLGQCCGRTPMGMECVVDSRKGRQQSISWTKHDCLGEGVYSF